MNVSVETVAEKVGIGIREGLFRIAEALSYGKCQHEWGEPRTLCTYQVQKCDKCGKVRRI